MRIKFIQNMELIDDSDIYTIGFNLIDYIERNSNAENEQNNPPKHNPFINLKFNGDSKNIINLINQYKKMIELVLLYQKDTKLHVLSASKRLYYYSPIFPDLLDNKSLEVSYCCDSLDSGSLIIDQDDININQSIPKDIFDNLLNHEYKILETYIVEYLEEALYISFMKMVSNDIVVKKCHNCGKFFIPSGRIDTEYCYRIAPNSTKACNEIGAAKQYYSRNKDNPVIQEFQKQYKRMNSRVRLKKITQNEFYSWSERARELRDSALKEEMNIEVFKNKLSKLEV